jgi:DNA-directed RNA polymerase specialized sigma24 family protein
MLLRDDSYELFRRAVVDRDANAWHQIALSYRAMMIGWARRSRAAELTGTHDEALADEALARAWRSLSPERFDQLSTMAALLGYLRTCVASTAIDAARAHAAAVAPPDWGGSAHSAPADLAIIERMSRAELWQLALHMASSDAERVVVFDRFVLGLPPRAIQHRHPLVFPELRKVYETIHDLCERLRRNGELRLMVGEHLAA